MSRRSSGVRRRRGVLHPLRQRTAVIEGLGYIRLEVTDLERALAFYRDGLRFQWLGSDDGPFPCARFMAGDLHLVLVLRQASPPLGRGVHLLVDVSGLDAYHDALVARGVDPTAPVDEPRARSFRVTDPDGYEWCFRQSLA